MKRLLLPALTLMLASCTSSQSQPQLTSPVRPQGSTLTQTATGATEVRDPLCSQIRIVALSHADTEDTKKQVIANNAVLRSVCGAGGAQSGR